MRLFYRTWPNPPTLSADSHGLPISPTASAKSGGRSIPQTASAESAGAIVPAPGGKAELPRFPLSWSHYVRLLSVRSDAARRFYEAETLRGGWTVRQLDRQIGTQFYERTALSRNKAVRS